MADKSAIEWTDATWPIVQGCDPVSPGCENCYAIKVVHRLAWSSNPKVSGPIKGCVEYHENARGEGKLRFTGKIALREDRLDWPLKWRQPRMIFVPSHGDLFHKDVPDEFIDKVFAVMALCPQHTFQVLTKRAERMRRYCSHPWTRVRIYNLVCDLVTDGDADGVLIAPGIDPALAPAGRKIFLDQWPLPDVWLGVSCERQQEADERIPHLLQTPAAIRFVSAEPLLGPIRLNDIEPGYSALLKTDSSPGLDWIIVGGESGPKARPMHPDWARSIRDQCKAAGVAFFFKQWGGNEPNEFSRVGEDGEIWRRTPSGKEHWFFDEINKQPGEFPGVRFSAVGKKSAGRLLDGREWNEFPQQQAGLAA